MKVEGALLQQEGPRPLHSPRKQTGGKTSSFWTKVTRLVRSKAQPASRH